MSAVDYFTTAALYTFAFGSICLLIAWWASRGDD